jgi:2,3-bisphosphoglycerate-dependent phosphoglycerate mutase
MTQILLVRHGQSQNNASPENQRVCDPDLTELGRKQANRTAEYLCRVGVTHLYCSPFLRSLETTRPLAECLRIPASIRGDLFERGGCYSGHLPDQQVGEPGLGRGRLIQAYEGWAIDPRIGDAGWWDRRAYEVPELAMRRARKVVQWFDNELQPQGGRHACVIHADFKRLLIAAMFGEPMERVLPRIGPLHNTGITVIEWSGGAWRLLSLNATTHLPSDYVTA